jgi:hypothetical protein
MAFTATHFEPGRCPACRRTGQLGDAVLCVLARPAGTAVHQQHIGAHFLAPDFDVIGQRREHPYAAAAVRTADRLEVNRAAEKLVDEREGFVVLLEPIALSDDAQHLARVLTDGRVEAGDLLAAGHPPLVGRFVAAVAGDRLLSTLQPSPDASMASATVAGGSSRTTPRPCQGVSRTENMVSESPADI